MNPDDTIVAISSPAGAAVRGIVRLSGPTALTVGDSVFESSLVLATNLAAATANCLLEGRVRVGRFRVPGFAMVFRVPRSYTGQDVVELHLIGAPVILGRVVEDCIASGARRAEPGEFTLRAYLAGRLDLSQAHGVAGMIAARSDMQLRAAERLLHGDLSRIAADAREALADLLSLVEGAMDFADEPIEFITPSSLRERLGIVLAALAATSAAGLRSERWEHLPRVVLAGRPNAGKSSLLNRLSGLDRAICAPVAGTTRDVISAPMQIDDFECLLIDAAGLGHGEMELDLQAQRAAREAMASADLVLWVVDVTERGGGSEGDLPPEMTAPILRVANKCDLSGIGDRCDVTVSAKTGEGLDDLRRAIKTKLRERDSVGGDATIALMAEHRASLEAAVGALDRAIALASAAGETLDDADLVAAELHVAADELAVLAGREQTEDMLGRIFSRFCVGK